jgi:hypothetical protein
MKQIFNRFEANKTGFIHLFRIEANQQILHANTDKNGIQYRYSLLSEYFIYFFSKRIFEAKICQYENNLRIWHTLDSKQYTYFVYHSS